MRILVVAPTPFFSDRGTHIRILEEALALEKRGHEITIATYHIGRDIDPRIKTKIDVRRIRRFLFWYKKIEAGPDWQKIILDLMLIRKTFYLARIRKPDIIHAHLHEGALIGWLVQKALFWRKIKLVCDFHGSLTREMISHNYLGSSLLKKIFKIIEEKIDNLGDYAVTSSQENTDEISTIRHDKKIETVLDGVNLDYYSNLPDKINSKKELELPTDKIIITYTGALVMNKGIKYLADAIKIVLNQNQNIFFIIGGFPIEIMEKFVKDSGLQKNVRLIHPLNYFDLPQILNASDIGIDPKDSSTRQASGKILQYMGASLPVICFDRVNNREYLGEGGFFVKIISSRALADEILKIAKNPECLKLKKLIIEDKIKKFGWNIAAEKIDNIYEQIKKTDI
jgi:glycosyltransferase involved in cell wall biosynthesis